MNDKHYQRILSMSTHFPNRNSITPCSLMCDTTNRQFVIINEIDLKKGKVVNHDPRALSVMIDHCNFRCPKMQY